MTIQLVFFIHYKFFYFFKCFKCFKTLSYTCIKIEDRTKKFNLEWPSPYKLVSENGSFLCVQGLMLTQTNSPQEGKAEFIYVPQTNMWKAAMNCVYLRSNKVIKI
jgi:hypothetical protein